MKLAKWFVLAALLAILVYPSTHTLAASPALQTDGPIVVLPQTPTGDLPPIDLSGSGDGDSGDADDLTGLRGGTRKPGQTVGLGGQDARIKLVWQMWWRILIWVR